MHRAIICDLDQTLCEGSEIIKKFLIEVDKKDWDSYYQNLDKCKLNNHIKDLIGCGIKKNIRIIFLTSRHEKSRKITEEWIKKHFCSDFYHCLGCQLIMREEKDFRPSAITKQDLYFKYIREKFKVICVIDDDKSVIDMFNKIGLNCLHVQANVQYIDEKEKENE